MRWQIHIPRSKNKYKTDSTVIWIINNKIGLQKHNLRSEQIAPKTNKSFSLLMDKYWIFNYLILNNNEKDTHKSMKNEQNTIFKMLGHINILTSLPNQWVYSEWWNRTTAEFLTPDHSTTFQHQENLKRAYPSKS